MYVQIICLPFSVNFCTNLHLHIFIFWCSFRYTHTRFVLRIVALLQRSKNDELPTILSNRVNVTHATDFSSIILKSIIFNKFHRDHAMYYQQAISFSILSAIFIHLKCILLCIICINRMFVTILQIKSSYCYCLNVPLVITYM